MEVFLYFKPILPILYPHILISPLLHQHFHYYMGNRKMITYNYDMAKVIGGGVVVYLFIWD